MGRRTLPRVIAGSLGAASLAVLLTISAATASADEPNPTPSPTVTPSVAPVLRPSISHFGPGIKAH